MKFLFIFFVCLVSVANNWVVGQTVASTQRKNLSAKIDTTNIDLKKFAQDIIGNTSGNYDKAKVLLDWLSNSLEWKATDYKKRTINEILARGGGNCFELARVYMTFIKEL